MALAGTGVFAEIIDGEVYKYYADGEWRSSASGKSVAIINPTTRQMQYRVQGASFAPPPLPIPTPSVVLCSVGKRIDRDAPSAVEFFRCSSC
jgi:hypothetical protein